MSLQRDILPEVALAIQEHHKDCSILLIGSVARQEELEHSDLDLNVFLPDASITSPWICDENRWQLQVKCVVQGIRVDVAWETFDYLDEYMKSDGPFWILSFGEIIHDPNGRIKPCLQRARRWAAENVELCQKMEADFRIFKKKQLASRQSRRIRSAT